MKIVAGLGTFPLDTILSLSQFPMENDKVYTQDFLQQIGGPAPVALLYLSRLGIETRLCSPIGEDFTGNFLQNLLEKENMQTKFLNTQKNVESAFSQIWLNNKTGSRTIAVCKGTLNPIDPKEISNNFLDNVSLIHMDGHEIIAGKFLGEKAKKKNILVSYDLGTYKKTSEELLKVADIVQAPIHSMNEMTGISDMDGNSRWIYKNFHVKLAVVTDGENGLFYTNDKGTFFQKSYKVNKIVDSNGAGDIFAGGLIFGLLNFGDDKRAIEFASASAALKCTMIGKKVLPTENEVLNFIASS